MSVPSAPEDQPIVIQWAAGAVGLGYVGNFRWRVQTADRVVEADDARAAARLALEHVFRGTTPEREVVERAPIRIRVGGQISTLDVDSRMVNGWTYSSSTHRFDVGPHAKLAAFVADLLARNAETAWAPGVMPVRPQPIGQELSFDAFASAAEPEALCQQLASTLTQRLRASPCPPVAFTQAMQELKQLGHDLWSWEMDEVWGHDYMTRRPGAGLFITRTFGETDEPAPSDEQVLVEFRSRE